MPAGVCGCGGLGLMSAWHTRGVTVCVLWPRRPSCLFPARPPECCVPRCSGAAAVAPPHAGRPDPIAGVGPSAAWAAPKLLAARGAPCAGMCPCPPWHASRRCRLSCWLLCGFVPGVYINASSGGGRGVLCPWPAEMEQEWPIPALLGSPCGGSPVPVTAAAGRSNPRQAPPLLSSASTPPPFEGLAPFFAVELS